MTDTWNDRDDYETSALESRDLFEQMCRNWSWPAPRTADAATEDQMNRAGLDHGLRDIGAGAIELVRLELPDDLGEIVVTRDTARDFARSIYDELEETPDGTHYGDDAR